MQATEVAEALYGRDPSQFPYDPLQPPLIGIGLYETGLFGMGERVTSQGLKR